MLNRHLKQNKFLLYILVVFLILSFISGCSNTNPTDQKPLNEPEQHQQVVKVNEGQNKEDKSAQENTEVKNIDKKQQPQEGVKEQEQTLTGELEVHFIDVEQADSILINLPNKQTVLIDAGNNEDSNLVVNYLQNEGIKKIDHVIGTHPHEDHIGGLDAVINTFDIGKVYLPKVNHTTKTYEDVLLAIKDKGLKVTQAKAGVALDVGSDVDAVLVAPNSSDYEDLNNYSTVLKLTFGNTAFLFTGDAEEQSEFEMLAQSRTQLKADVLKVGHHGSSSSTSTEFLKVVSPKYAVISVGKDNTYGHPHVETLEKLNDAGVSIFQTSLQDTIVAKSDGVNITFNKAPMTIGFMSKKEPINNTQTQNDSSKIISTSRSVSITNIDLSTEIVTIKNTATKEVDLSGWKLVSIKGNQVYDFPTETILKPGGTIKIVSGRNAKESQNVLLWTKSYIWNNDGDSGSLYDNQGNLVSEYK